MADRYATWSEYVERTGDDATPRDRVESMIEDLSAELRAECGITGSMALSQDAMILARKLVVDAARKALVPPKLEGLEGDLSGARQASFTANGFSGSLTLSNSTGSAWFDSRSLARFKRLTGRSQRMGFVYPYYGG